MLVYSKSPGVKHLNYEGQSPPLNNPLRKYVLGESIRQDKLNTGYMGFVNYCLLVVKQLMA